MTSVVAVIRGAPYARPSDPTTRTRSPGRGAEASRGTRNSTAAVASWTTERRPVESRSVLETLTVPSTVTLPVPRRSAAAMVMIGAADAPGRGVAPGDGVGLGVAPAERARSAGSRSQRR